MKFMTAREARERMGQPDKYSVDLAKKQFKEVKPKIFREIEIGVAEGKVEIEIDVLYPASFAKYSLKNYKEKFISLVNDLFPSLGYSVYFKKLPEETTCSHWGELYISWNEE